MPTAIEPRNSDQACLTFGRLVTNAKCDLAVFYRNALHQYPILSIHFSSTGTGYPNP